jgi:hypothetical protein
MADAALGLPIWERLHEQAVQDVLSYCSGQEARAPPPPAH